MTDLVLVLGDQLSPDLPSLRQTRPEEADILMVEALSETDYVWHHRKKMVLIFSAMRHFAAELRDVTLDPLERRQLVEVAVVTRELVANEEAQCAKAVIGNHHNRGREVGDGLSVIEHALGGAINVCTAGKEDHDREVPCGVDQARSEDTQEETVLVHRLGTGEGCGW